MSAQALERRAIKTALSFTLTAVLAFLWRETRVLARLSCNLRLDVVPASVGAVRSFSPLQVALLVSLCGSVLAVFVPAFAKNLRISRMVEPMDGLAKIGARATLLAASRPVESAYPPSVGRTPEDVPKGASVHDAGDVWLHPTWKELGFSPTQPHFFSFQFDSKNGAKRSKFTARAVGDLDGDGIFSQFEVSGEMVAGEAPVLNPIEMDREVE